jgi:hypothetical protein
MRKYLTLDPRGERGEETGDRRMSTSTQVVGEAENDACGP